MIHEVELVSCEIKERVASDQLQSVRSVKNESNLDVQMHDFSILDKSDIEFYYQGCSLDVNPEDVPFHKLLRPSK